MNSIKIIPKLFNRNVFLLARNFHATANTQTNVAVVLSGCGVYDGSEVHEASAVLVHLSRSGADVSMFAPDKPQAQVANHLKGGPKEESRNVLEESARIARGKVQPLSEIDVSNFDAVIFPGGFGAALNLSTFGVDGPSMKVDPEVEQVLQNFHSSKKPIGLCCIAPVLAAKVIKNCEVTMGSDKEEGGKWPFAGACGAIEALGAKHVKKNVNEVHVDQANKIVTTPAYMCDTAVHEIHDGIGEMVKAVLKFAK